MGHQGAGICRSPRRARSADWPRSCACRTADWDAFLLASSLPVQGARIACSPERPLSLPLLMLEEPQGTGDSAFTSSFPIWTRSILFSGLGALARMSSKMLTTTIISLAHTSPAAAPPIPLAGCPIGVSCTSWPSPSPASSTGGPARPSWCRGRAILLCSLSFGRTSAKPAVSAARLHPESDRSHQLSDQQATLCLQHRVLGSTRLLYYSLHFP